MATDATASARQEPSAKHADGIERRGNLSVGTDGDDTGTYAQNLELSHDFVCGSLTNTFTGVSHAARNVMSYHMTDEVLPLAGAGHRAGTIASVGARTN